MNAAVRLASEGFVGWCRAWIVAWDRFFFTPIDPRPLAALRIATGLLATWAGVVWFLDAESFFGDSGWMAPHDVWRMTDQPWQWSWYFAATTSELRLAAAIVAILAAVLLTVGLATPVAAWVSLAALVSAVNRAPLNVFGFDDMLGMLLISMVIGPAGAAWSLDRWLRPEPVSKSVRANVALRLLQLHLCVVYLFSGCGKLLGGSWWEGMALWGSVANVQYRTLDLTWMAGHTWLLNLLTLGTLFWEVGYAALVWPRLTRPLVLAMAIFVHLGIGMAMGMMEFGLTMIVANMAFAADYLVEFLDRRDCRPAEN